MEGRDGRLDGRDGQLLRIHCRVQLRAQRHELTEMALLAPLSLREGRTHAAQA